MATPISGLTRMMACIRMHAKSMLCYHLEERAVELWGQLCTSIHGPAHGSHMLITPRQITLHSTLNSEAATERILVMKRGECICKEVSAAVLETVRLGKDCSGMQYRGQNDDDKTRLSTKGSGSRNSSTRTRHMTCDALVPHVGAQE